LPSDGFGLQKQARDLKRLLDHLAIDEVQLVGSSAGGPIAVLFASNFPDRVRSLVLVGTALHLFPLGDEPSDLIRQQLLVMDQDGPEFAFDARPAGIEVSFDPLWELEQAEASGTLDEFQKAQQKLAMIAKQVPKQERIKWYVAELNSIRAYVEADLRVATRFVEAPTLVIHGGEDKVVPLEWAKELADAIPGTTLHVVEGGSHGLMSRDPSVRAVAIDFFAAHAEDSPGHENIDRR
jgi:pimeloyl-ACP methyl ester carboxylesterase